MTSKDGATDTLSMDVASVSLRSPGIKTIWTQHVYSKPHALPTTPPFTYYVQRSMLAIKCTEKTTSTVVGIFYPSKDLAGTPRTVDLKGWENEFSQISPDSVGEDIAAFVCTRK